MPKISNQNKYPEQEIVNKKDYVIGTDYYDKKKTKTFPIENLAEVLAEILIEKGGITIDVGKTSQLINDGEFGDSRFVEENELEQLVNEILANLDKYEVTENKQDNLNPDGTGTKYPTVDAVNNEFNIINERIDNLENIVVLPIYHYFANETIVTINHNIGQYVNVIVLIGTEKVIADIEYTPDMNSITVRFERLETGLIIIN